jgi:type IV secretory pathway VirB3-like protein
MTRPTLYALVAVTGAVMAGIALGMVFVFFASVWYSLTYGGC